MTTPLESIIAIALEYFSSRDIQATAEQDSIITPRGRYGLLNLAQQLRAVPEERWGELIEAHFDRLGTVSTDVSDDYGEVRSRLRTRLAATEDPPPVVRRELAAGLHELLMLKIPAGGMTIGPASLENWDVSLDQVWVDARNHTRWDEPHTHSTLLSPGGARFLRIDGSFWSSSLLTDLDSLMPQTGPAGVLAVVPCQDLLVAWPLAPEPPWTDLVSVAMGMFATGPGSVSPDIYWSHPDGVERVVRCEEVGPVPEWSDAFRAALGRAESAA